MIIRKKDEAKGEKNSGGKSKTKKKLSTVNEGDLSPQSPLTTENTSFVKANTKELSSELLSVQLNEISGSKEEKRKEEESIKDKNSFIVSHAREEPSLLDKARDWVSKNVSDRPIAAGGSG